MKTDHLNNDLLVSQIVLLKEALSYYANEDNYLSSVDKDRGHFARHTLGLVKGVTDSIDAANDEYKNSLTSLEKEEPLELTEEQKAALEKLNRINEMISKNLKSDL